MRNVKYIVTVAVMAAAITASSIYTHQSFLRIMPLYVSLVIMLMQSRVNRYAYVIGGINACIYGVVYIYYGMYGFAANAFLMSCPLQIATFIRWKKRAYKQSVVLRKMSAKLRIAVAALGILAFAAYYLVLKLVGSASSLWESASTILSLAATLLTLLAYIEYTYLSLASSFANVVLFATVMLTVPEQLPYLIYNTYAFVCMVIQFVSARRLYKAQQK